MHETKSYNPELEKENKLNARIDAALKNDQQDSTHSKAQEEYKNLIDIKDEVQGTRLEKKYWNAVSILRLHMGQQEAILSNNPESAQQHVKESLGAAENSGDEDWTNYLRGTLAYLQNDKKTLEIIVDSGKSDNKEVLERLLSGLKKRGYPEYGVDY